MNNNNNNQQNPHQLPQASNYSNQATLSSSQSASSRVDAHIDQQSVVDFQNQNAMNQNQNSHNQNHNGFSHNENGHSQSLSSEHSQNLSKGHSQKQNNGLRENQNGNSQFQNNTHSQIQNGFDQQQSPLDQREVNGRQAGNINLNGAENMHNSPDSHRPQNSAATKTELQREKITWDQKQEQERRIKREKLKLERQKYTRQSSLKSPGDITS